MTSNRERRALVAVLIAVAGCTQTTSPSDLTGVRPDNHRWYPVGPGTPHAVGETIDGTVVGCDACHTPQADTFTEFACTGCHAHQQSLTDPLHLKAPGYTYSPKSCYACHRANGSTFDHTGITSGCAACHDVGATYAALPVPGFTHQPISSDCGGCHTTDSWANGSTAPTNSFDPSQNITVTAQVPSYAETSIVSLTPSTESLPMVMNHATIQVPAATVQNCANCHENADQGAYFPGRLHVALDRLGLAQPTACSSCHTASTPTGFVGPTVSPPSRTPASPEMKHDAVAWAAGAPTTTPLVTQDCGLCHRAPTETAPSTWAASATGVAPKYHAALTAAAATQPASCLDCHANSRPTGVVTSGSKVFDHADPQALGDCAVCHTNGGSTQWTSWAGGGVHLAGQSEPPTCLPCHEGERPTSTASWKSTTYTQSPFDYVATAGGPAHGDAQDCVSCHAAGTTGSPSWVGGSYTHGTGPSASTCFPCHKSQRPTQVVSGFNHSTGGTGDCFGCHQDTVKRKAYVKYPNDWSGGQNYPANSLIAAPGQFVSVTSITLTRGANQLITGMTSSAATLNNAMLHTSTALPESLNAGLTPDYTKDFGKCWHCHTNTNGTVSDFTNGVLHAAFNNFKASPSGTSTKLPQLTTCLDCHDKMRPPHIVEKAASSLVPMDHSATFTGSVVIAGAAVTSVGQLDCSACHGGPGTNWTDGRFHSLIGSAVPADCASCHYPLMADAPKSDLTSGTRYAMKHRSSQLTTQACQTCHASALAKAASPSTASQWIPGALHAAVPGQPAACNDCHVVSKPAGNTQSSVTYTFAKGGTTTNGAQWMSHGAGTVTGKDCAVCHAGDAKTSGSAWNAATLLHAKVTGLTTCNECHGGSVPGANNNLPSGLTDSSTVTTSSASAGTHDQIIHTDVNVTKFQCNFCHTQVGVSTAGGVQGKEWAQAKFHKNFTTASPLVMNGSTGRCSNCHLGLKPGSSYSAFDHSPYSGTSAQDCSSCHAWPGTSATTPNWLGTAAAHATSGSSVSSTLDCKTCHGQSGSAQVRLTVSESSHYGGVSNGNNCNSCHVNFAGFSGTTTNLSYKHSNSSANGGGCVTCHAFKSQIYTTLTTTPQLNYPVSSGGHTFSQTFNVNGRYDDRSFNANHTASKLTSCGACHGYSNTTSGTNIWTFVHRPGNPGISNGKGSNGCNECH